MSRWLKDDSQSMGRTRLVQVSRVIDSISVTVLARIQLKIGGSDHWLFKQESKA
jgi:hypothetical protein